MSISQILVEQQQQQQQQQQYLDFGNATSSSKIIPSTVLTTYDDLRPSDDYSNKSLDNTAAMMLSLQPVSMTLIAAVLILESPQHLDTPVFESPSSFFSSNTNNKTATATSPSVWNNAKSNTQKSTSKLTPSWSNICKNNSSAGRGDVVTGKKGMAPIHAKQTTVVSPSAQTSNNTPHYKRATGNYVYLLPRSWMINWLIWANHQSCTVEELPHKQPLFIELCELLQLDHEVILNPDTLYTDPGPIDATSLSLMGHPLLLKPNIVFGKGTVPDMMQRQQNRGRSKTKQEEPKIRRSSSLSGLSKIALEAPKTTTAAATNDRSFKNNSIGCCAVSESFYEYIKSIHGVRCNDFKTVSFQSTASSSSSAEVILHHHEHRKHHHPSNTPNHTKDEQQEPKPIEFRRRVIHGVTDLDYSSCTRSIVEIYPIKFIYSVMESFASPTINNTKQLRNADNNNGSLPDNASIPVSSPNNTAKSPLNYREILQSAATKLKHDKQVVGNKKSHFHVQTLGTEQSFSFSSPKVTRKTPRGFVLVSRTSPMDQAIKAILDIVAADKSIDCKRCWVAYSFSCSKTELKKGVSKHNSVAECNDSLGQSLSNLSSSSSSTRHLSTKDEAEARSELGTEFGDGYELWTDLFSTSKTQQQCRNDCITVEEFLQHTGIHNSPSSALLRTGMQQVKYNLILETRHNSQCYSRKSLELCNRIQVGDFVDAQDNRGKWYEAIVREVTHDLFKVHYIGWSSRWDSWIRRFDQNYYPSESAYYRLPGPPAPLWSRTKNWRHTIRVGDDVEVREVASLVQRPKWFPAKVVLVGREADPIRSCDGGAQLEALEPDYDDPGRLRPLLLLHRTRQVLVEVPKENFNSLIPAKFLPTTALLESDDPTPNPPYIRWVNLYGEEICNQYTHNEAPTSGMESIAPATIRYDLDASRKPVEVLQTFNNVYGAGFVRESIKGIPPAPGSVGLHNLGNSCFLNSILQCLNHIEPLTQFFLSGDFKADLNKTNPLGSGGIVARAYAALLNDMWSGEYATLAPRSLKTTVAQFAPQFNNCYQHDSQEFCSFLMDGLHEDLNRVIEKPYIEDLEGRGLNDDVVAMESWRRHLLRHDSVIVDHCQGMHRSHLTCPDCGHESVKFDVYSTISLPIPGGGGKKKIPLSASLESFTSAEELDEENAWYCSQCQKHVCAKKRITLWSTPDILILHLKRFEFNSCKKVVGRIVRSKVETKVDFPVDGLDMRPYMKGPINEEYPPIYNVCFEL